MNFLGEVFFGLYFMGLFVFCLKGLYLLVVFWDSNCLVNNRYLQEDILVKFIISI